LEQGADLSDAGLHGTDLSEADLQGVDLREVKYNKDTKFPESVDPEGAWVW